MAIIVAAMLGHGTARVALTRVLPAMRDLLSRSRSRVGMAADWMDHLVHLAMSLLLRIRHKLHQPRPMPNLCLSLIYSLH